MRRHLVPLFAALLMLPAAFGEGQPQTITLTPPKSNVTVRLVTLAATGEPTPEGQKVLDEMIEEGWRAGGITTVSSGSPVTVAVMFLRNARGPAQPQPGGPGMQGPPPQPGGPGQGGGQLPPGAAQPPGFGQGAPPGGQPPRPPPRPAPPPTVNDHNP
jgi:hypothetical protein